MTVTGFSQLSFLNVTVTCSLIGVDDLWLYLFLIKNHPVTFTTKPKLKICLYLSDDFINIPACTWLVFDIFTFAGKLSIA